MKSFTLTPEEKNQVINRTDYYIDLANKQYQLKLASIQIKFDLKGSTSGMFVVRGDQVFIRYNEVIFSQYYDDSLFNTVAHEVAHYVVYKMWGARKVKPHGKEWKQVMTEFGVKPDVKGSYDISALPLHRQAQHDYTCGCMMHQLSTTRHNKVQRKKAVYKCRKCQQSLSYIV